MPDYTIIAGPNGAGKSTFSADLSSPEALIFDADKIKAIKEKEYPDIPAESIEMMITSAYWHIEDMAVEGQSDLTVESNLRNEFLIDRLSFFKSRGYTTNLIYMLLPDIDSSIDRVALRVAQKGHFIDLESIKYNFEHGLVMLIKHFNKFDNLLLVESSLETDPSLFNKLLLINDGNIHFLALNPPSWARPIIDKITKNLKTN